jgi:hypothetical protein
MEKNFESYEELTENLSRGGEVEFEYKGKQYSITHVNEGVHVMEFYNYDSAMIYKNREDVGEYQIEGEYLRDIVPKLNITFR